MLDLVAVLYLGLTEQANQVFTVHPGMRKTYRNANRLPRDHMLANKHAHACMDARRQSQPSAL